MILFKYLINVIITYFLLENFDLGSFFYEGFAVANWTFWVVDIYSEILFATGYMLIL